MAAILSQEKRDILTKDFLFHEYHTLKKSTYIIAKDLGIGDRTVRLHLIKNNIKLRTQKKSCQSRNQSKSKNPNYKHGKSTEPTYCCDCGKELSDYRKQRCLSCNSTGSRSNFYGKPPSHGKHFDYKGYHLRSSYELKYAEYLDSNNILWSYEPKAFELGDGRTYTPDFYLIKENVWIEVKGYWRDDAKEKFELFKEKYPQLHIVLLTKDILKSWGLI